MEYSGKEEITPYAGFAMYGEMYKGIGMDKEINSKLPAPGSGRGFKPNAYVNPLVLMFLGGGKYMEDIRKIKADKGLRRVCKLKTIPTSDAIGNWCRKESKEKSQRLGEVNDEYVVRALKKSKQQKYTIDMDAFGIEANKSSAKNAQRIQGLYADSRIHSGDWNMRGIRNSGKARLCLRQETMSLGWNL